MATPISKPIADSEPPQYIAGQDGEPSRYEIPNEAGYFPAGSDDIGAVAELENVTLYQIHPRYHGETKEGKPLARGKLTVRDPDGGTADDVVLVMECTSGPSNNYAEKAIIFYMMNYDVATKLSEKEFILMLPQDCIILDMTECTDDRMILHIEGLLAARTKFHDQTNGVAVEGVEEIEGAKAQYPEGLPPDAVSQTMFKTAAMVSRLIVSASKIGADQIDTYGEKKRESVTTTKEVKVSKTSIKVAKATRTASEKTQGLAVRLSDKISDVVGSKIGRAAAIKDNDSSTKKKARSLLLASFISYSEVAGGASEGYEIMVKSAQSQATSFVSKKYGEEAAQLARHTGGAAANFGRAALTSRRVVDVKKIAKTAGKQMVEESAKTSLEGKKSDAI